MGSVIYWLFLASGAAGLIYEVVWMRMLMRILGGTVLAYTIVLSAFMLGLALGGWHFGRRIDRRGRPLLVYAALEVGVGAWAILLPFGLALAVYLFASAARGLPDAPLLLHAVRSLLAFAALLVPTTLMGGTLPVLSKFLVQRERDLGPRVGQLYAINTVGALLGAGAAGFVLIGTIGEIRTTLIGVLLNLTAAGGALVLARSGRREAAPSADLPAEREAAQAPPVSGWRNGLLLVVVAVTGFTILAYEVLWTRTAVLLLSNTTYSFSVMLLSFLTGIAVGSAVMASVLRWWQPSWDARWRLFAALQVLIGIVALLSLASTVPVVGLVYPLWTRFGGPLVDWFAGPVPAVFLLLAPLTLLSGASFPIAASLYARGLSLVGRSVGAVYLWNTIGAAAGSAAAGFLFLPRLGIAHSFLVCIAINAVAGIAMMLSLPTPRFVQRLRPALAWAAIAALCLGLSARATGGLDLPRTLLRKRLERPYQRGIFYQEDINGIVSVWINPTESDPWLNNKRLYIDAQPMAAAYRFGMLYERLQAHYPLLLHPDPQDVLVICLGTGTTLGSAGQYPVATLDCVELSPSVVAAGTYFEEETHNILEDPRLTLYVDDGRNYLLATQRSYDVITAEPMHPHLAGTVNLYTREYFQLVRSRLRPDGICSHWIPLYKMRPDEVKAAIRAFSEVFPHTILFLESGDAIILGSDQPLTIDVARWRRVLSNPAIASDLAEVGLSSVPQFLSTYVMADDAVKAYVRDVPPVTDDLPTLEFYGSQAAAETGTQDNISGLLPHRARLDDLLPRLRGALTDEEAARLGILYPLEKVYLRAFADLASRDAEAARTGFLDVLRLAPDDKRAEVNLKMLQMGRGLPQRTADIPRQPARSP